MVVGIIAEYNPFHNGHRYQIDQIRKKIKNAVIIVAMSGNFTQRGEPAILDKFTRAKLAINSGCDLVFELPFVFTVRSAQDFARGGISLLNNTGVVDFLAFGAETNDLELLQRIADLMDSDEFNEQLREKLHSGISYANAICQTLSKNIGISEEKLRQPNTILAIEYLRAIKSTSIKPVLIPRFSADYKDKILHNEISSASAIRNSIYSKKPDWDDISKNVDYQTLTALKNSAIPLFETLYRPIILKIISNNADELRKIYGMNEGLEFKIINAALMTNSFNEFVDNILSRRYTRSTIQRLLLYILISLKKEQVQKFDTVKYLRVLAFNQRGQEILRLIKNKTSIPIITKIAQHITSRAIYKRSKQLNIYQEMLKFDIISTDIYSILFSTLNLRQDFLKSPFVL